MVAFHHRFIVFQSPLLGLMAFFIITWIIIELFSSSFVFTHTNRKPLLCCSSFRLFIIKSLVLVFYTPWLGRLVVQRCLLLFFCEREQIVAFDNLCSFVCVFATGRACVCDLFVALIRLQLLHLRHWMSELVHVCPGHQLCVKGFSSTRIFEMVADRTFLSFLLHHFDIFFWSKSYQLWIGKASVRLLERSFVVLALLENH